MGSPQLPLPQSPPVSHAQLLLLAPLLVPRPPVALMSLRPRLSRRTPCNIASQISLLLLPSSLPQPPQPTKPEVQAPTPCSLTRPLLAPSQPPPVPLTPPSERRSPRRLLHGLNNMTRPKRFKINPL